MPPFPTTYLIDPIAADPLAPQALQDYRPFLFGQVVSFAGNSLVTKVTGGCKSSFSTAAAYYLYGLGADEEVYANVDVPPSAQSMSLFVRAPDPFGSSTRYQLTIASGGNWTITWNITGGGGSGNVGLTVNRPLQAGDKIGLQVVGARLTSYLYRNGVWAPVTTGEDTHIPDPGYFGWLTGNNVATFSSLSGGLYAPATSDTPPIVGGRGAC